MPIRLLDYGMQFRIKSDVFTFLWRNENGMIEARDKFGLTCEFNPSKIVYI